MWAKIESDTVTEIIPTPPLLLNSNARPSSPVS